jgi:hypothetical protein
MFDEGMFTAKQKWLKAVSTLVSAWTVLSILASFDTPTPIICSNEV